MARLIDADALIESICHTADLGGWIGDTLRNIKRLAVRYINETPTIDAVSEWIPCSERLPEKDGRYLTTYPLIRDMKWVNILWYGKPSMPSRDVQGKVWYVSDEEYGDVPYDDVIAWMPLPKPYKEDGK